MQSEPPASNTNSDPPSRTEAGSSYFRSLWLQNIRCFANNQQLNLASTAGGAARWSLILGENGVGKTTLLQLLALGAAQKRTFPAFDGRAEHISAVPRLLDEILDLNLVRARKHTAQVSYQVSWANSLEESKGGLNDRAAFEYKRGEWIGGAYYEPANFIVYGYGANRRRAPNGLTAEASDDPTRTLFDDDATLRNPEEWLLQNELVANTSSPLQDRARLQRNRVRDILTRILPGIDDIRVTTRSTPKQQVRAGAEVHGPDGWIPFSALGLGYRTMTAWIVDLSSRLFERYGTLTDPFKRTGGMPC